MSSAISPCGSCPGRISSHQKLVLMDAPVHPPRLFPESLVNSAAVSNGWFPGGPVPPPLRHPQANRWRQSLRSLVFLVEKNKNHWSPHCKHVEVNMLEPKPKTIRLSDYPWQLRRFQPNQIFILKIKPLLNINRLKHILCLKKHLLQTKTKHSIPILND